MVKKTNNKDSKFRNALIIAMIPVAMGLFTLAISIHISSIKNQIDHLSKQLDSRSNNLSSLDNAIVDVRAYLLANKLLCKNNKYNGDNIKMRYNLIIKTSAIVKNGFLIWQNFMYEDVEKDKTRILVSNILDNKNICSSDYPSDDNLKAMQWEVYKYYSEYIHKLNENIKEIESNIFL